MKQRRRIYYSAAQRAEIWDRWQAGEPMSSVGRRFDRESSSVFSVISPTGGIRPPARRRAREALSLFEREEISRGLSTQCSLRLIARRLGRSASTISREVSRNGGSDRYRASRSDQAAWDRALRPKLCKLACRPFLSRAHWCLSRGSACCGLGMAVRARFEKVRVTARSRSERVIIPTSVSPRITGTRLKSGGAEARKENKTVQWPVNAAGFSGWLSG